MGWRVRCTECDRSLDRESRTAAEETVEEHNDRRHDGESVAMVVGETDPLDSFRETLEDPSSRLFYVHRTNGVYRTICLECEGIEVLDDRDEAWDLAERHNDFAHDGESVAGVVREDLEETKDRRIPISSGESKASLLAEMTELEVVTR